MEQVTITASTTLSTASANRTSQTGTLNGLSLDFVLFSPGRDGTGRDGTGK